MPSKPKSLPKLTQSLAERHEALWLRLMALHSQLAATAARRPAAPLGEATSRVAEALLHEAAHFRGEGEKLPMPAPDAGGALAQIGQALAGLESYELAHSGWDGEQKCFVWLLGSRKLPIRRLRPQVDAGRLAGDNPEMRHIQEQLARRINAITKGLPDAEDGPPRARSYAPQPTDAPTYPRVRNLG